MREAEQQIYFFDTSALVKRYHQELGTKVLDTAFANIEVAKVISDITIIEFSSAFAKKVRIGEITAEDFREAIKAMAADIQSGVIQVESFGENEKKEAAVLIEKHGLSRNMRTLDAIRGYAASLSRSRAGRWKDLPL
jgi:hypothetical protein